MFTLFSLNPVPPNVARSCNRWNTSRDLASKNVSGHLSKYKPVSRQELIGNPELHSSSFAVHSHMLSYHPVATKEYFSFFFFVQGKNTKIPI